MAALDFLNRNHEVRAAFFNHGNEDDAAQFVAHYCHKNSIAFIHGDISTGKPSGKSPEEHWRDERYKFLDGLGDVVTGHHLDDVAETWVWSCLNGTPSLIPVKRNNVIRPFLLNSKFELESWATKQRVPFIADPSNSDTKHVRNLIRKDLMPTALKVNPGIHKMLRKKLIDFYSQRE